MGTTEREAVRMEWPAVSARRLARSALAVPSASLGPAGIAGALCGAHAQVPSAAELSLGLRGEALTRSAVRAALLEEASLIKMYGPRGTIHLLPVAELPMWVGALTALPRSPGPFAKDVRMTPEQTEEVVAAIGAALRGAELTVDELSEAVIAATGPWAGDPVMPAFQGKWPRWRQAIALASHRGQLCFGPHRGRKVTYARPRALTTARPLESTVALAALVQRYLHAYGPATPQNFARWLGVAPRWATELFDSLAGALQRVDFEGTTAWVNAGDTAMPGEPPCGVRLLPYFDAYVVACRPREHLYPGAMAARALTPSGQAGNHPVLLIDGVVSGVWHQRRSGRRLAVTVEPRTPLTAAQRTELDAQVERLAYVGEADAELTIGTIGVGPHA